MKDFLIKVASMANSRGLPFLVVGGNAVILLGVPRFTRDIDFLITDEYRDDWQKLMEQLGYCLFHRVDAFDQFEAMDKTGGGSPGVDFMLVDAAVWLKLVTSARLIETADGTMVLVPDPLHLIAMKLSAATSPFRKQDAQDYADIVALLKKHQMSLNNPDVSAIIMKFGGKESFERLEKML